MKVHRFGRRDVAAAALTAAALAIGPSTARAQGGIDARCPAGTLQQRAAQDACQKAVDIFGFMAPQLGIGLVGGNATLGTGGALGGIGRFSIGVRGNGIQGRVPQVADVNAAVTGAVKSDYGVDDQVMGLPAVEGALGLFGGVPLGVTHAFALDGLVSATYVPELSSSDVSVSLPDGSLKFGFGARLGVLQESFATPSVSVTYLRRDLPTTSIVASSGDDRIAVENIAVKTTALRAVVGKSFGFLGLAAGGGKDDYDSGANGSVTVHEAGLTVNGGPYTLSQKVSRTNMFADLSLNFPFIKFAFEIGRVSGGKLDTFNTFSGKRADDALTYASVGIRIGN
jgi:hypothetical protein